MIAVNVRVREICYHDTPMNSICFHHFQAAFHTQKQPETLFFTHYV